MPKYIMSPKKGYYNKLRISYINELGDVEGIETESFNRTNFRIDYDY